MCVVEENVQHLLTTSCVCSQVCLLLICAVLGWTGSIKQQGQMTLFSSSSGVWLCNKSLIVGRLVDMKP